MAIGHTGFGGHNTDSNV